MFFYCPRCKRGKIQYRCRPDETEEQRFRRLYYLDQRSEYVMSPDYAYSRNCLECDWNETITKETFELAAQELGRLRREKKDRVSVRPLTFSDLQLNERFRFAKFPALGDWVKATGRLRLPLIGGAFGRFPYETHPNEEVILLSMQNNEQPMPKKTDEVTTYELVHKDLDGRKALGIKKYGVALQPNNGRDSLQDAYEEALDLVVYLRNQIAKNASEGSDAAELAVMRGPYGALSGIVDKQNEELAKLRADPTQDRIIASQSAALVKASEDVARLRRDNERLSSQLVEVNNLLSNLRGQVDNLRQINANENRRIVELLTAKKFPAEVWNIVTQAFYYGWNRRTECHPADQTTVLNMCRAKMKEIFKHLELPEIPG